MPVVWVEVDRVDSLPALLRQAPTHNLDKPSRPVLIDIDNAGSVGQMDTLP
jgi:hypothetical protein